MIKTPPNRTQARARTLAQANSAWFVGLDLAWGDCNGDGLCLMHATRRSARVLQTGHTFGDAALLAWLKQHVPVADAAMILVDAPLIITNATGTRPVDRLTHRLFHREHAGCHPANLGKCPRPARLGQLLLLQGYALDWDLRRSSRLAAEVYPHPAMVRLFALDRIVKYKKGPIGRKRLEFARLQSLIRKVLADHFPKVALDPDTTALLLAPWTKPLEDRTDALFCALIGYHHWLHRGKKSETIGDTETGFILLPSVLEPLVA